MLTSLMCLFQSTLPREERLSNVDFKSIPYISIHAPTRGATIVEEWRTAHPEDFNPRSHERSDNKSKFKVTRGGISIHAPTRGATGIPLVYKSQRVISIHAPTRGATAILHKKFVYFYTIPTINI